MTFAEKLTLIAENEKRVFDAGYAKGSSEGGSGYEQGVADGKKVEYDAFWDAYQKNGNRSDYNYAFYAWDGACYKPKYPLVGMLSGCFTNSTITDTVVPIKIVLNRTTAISAVFQNCQSLKTIPYVEFSHYGDFRNTVFGNCYALENLNVVADLENGICINSNNFDVHWSEKLSHDSLVSIINALADKTSDTSGTEWVCTLGTTNLNKLSATEIAVATGKGWVLL